MDNIDEQYDFYRRENFKKLGPVAFVIYTLLAFTDYSILQKNLGILLVLRVLFVTPTAFLSLMIDRLSPRNIDAILFASFISATIGVSVISYLLGGIKSDYYFGVVIISFLQYAFVPMRFKYQVIFDVIAFTVFFIPNIVPFETETSEIVKQTTNYLSFIILKVVLAIKSEGLLKDALNKTVLEKELENKRKFQLVLGELLHLLNNPLFISMGLTQRIIKDNELTPENDKKLEKIQEANFRMEKVLRRIREIQQERRAPEDPQNFNFDDD